MTIKTMRQKRLKMLSFRASDEEIARFKNLVVEVQKIHPLAKDSDVLRDLVGLTNHKLVTSKLRTMLLPDEAEQPAEKREKAA